MNPLSAYLPTDRRHALAAGKELPEYTRGAALLADISGFTPLSDALVSALGLQRGAEELSRYLNLVFDALIAEVDRYRGSVLVFSGDAITCWFDGDNGQRAVTCGLAMQTAMQAFAALKTSGGSVVALAMKAAIAAGPARRLVVGDPAIQKLDVLAGATLDRMAAGEKHASRGDVVVDAATLALLADRVVEKRDVSEGQGAFWAVTQLKRRAPAQPWPAAEETAPGDWRAWLLAPVYARLSQGPAQFLAEIRPNVALFMSFSGLDYDADPAAGRKLDALIRRAQAILGEQEAFILQLTLGDKGCYLYASFGAPLAHEDDPLRAVTAAQKLHALRQEFAELRAVQIGLNEGRVWSGAYGGQTRHTYGVLGDAVNVAARLMSAAGAGETLLNVSIAKAVETQYATAPAGALKLKGKPEPFAAFRLAGPRAASMSEIAAMAAHALVGRERELARLNELWAAVRQGHGQVVRVSGAAGIGKSHLVQEFAAEAVKQGGRVGRGLADSADQATAYRPWRPLLLKLLSVPQEPQSPAQLADSVEQAVTAIDPEWAARTPLLREVLGLPFPAAPAVDTLDAKLRQAATWSLVTDLVRAAAGRQPLLLWFDNVHSLDEASRTLIFELSRAVARSPIMLVCTQRPSARDTADPLAEWAGWPHGHTLDLRELSEDALTTLVQDRLAGRLRPLALALILKQAQGNAFYAGELVEAMREAGRLVRRADDDWLLSAELFASLHSQHCVWRDPEHGWWTLTPHAAFSAETLGIPDTIQRAVTARVDQLPPEAQLTLKTASVIGPRFEAEILARAHPQYPGREALEAQLADLERRGLMRPAAGADEIVYAFEHNLIQEGVYDNLLAEQRRGLHASVGQVLEEVRPDALEQLAHHFSQARVTEKALHYLGQAADKAKHAYINETALKYYEQALALEARWEWRRARVEILHILGRRPEQRTALEQLAAPPAAPAFETAFLWGQYYEAVSDYAQAELALEQARRLAREHFHRINEGASLNQLGLIEYRRGHYAEARTWFEQARRVFPERARYAPEEARLLAQAANGAGLALMEQGALREAEAWYQKALALYRQYGDQRGEAQTLNNLGATAAYGRDLDQAVQLHQQALGIRRRIGDRLGESISLTMLAQAQRDLGDYLPAQANLQTALVIQHEIGNLGQETNTWNDLGILHEQLGRLADARACLERARELSQSIGDEAGQVFAASNLGLVLADAGEATAAEGVWLEGLALAQRQQMVLLEAAFASYLGALYAQQQAPARAIEYAQRALMVRTQQGLTAATADDLTTLAEAHWARHEAAAALGFVRQALAVLESQAQAGAEFPQRTYLISFHILDGAGETAAAQAALHTGYAWVMARAGRLTDPDLRRSYLENSPHNRRLVETARQVLQR